MRGIKIFILGIILCVTYVSNTKAVQLYGALFSHDPATIIKDGDTYWHFYTSPGLRSAYSKNLVNWSTSNNYVFSLVPSWKNNYPAWTLNYIDNNGDGNTWAPDIIKMNGAYYLYYSVSTFGSSKSAIGLAVTSSLNNPNWVDQGMVVSSSGNSNDINAIDPGLFLDDDGRLWMTYGSWFGGIGVVELDTKTGKKKGLITKIYGGGHQSIEAPAIFKDGGYYYLVVNRGTCCNGVNSSYYLSVGRSKSILGPYDGFRTLLPNKDGKYIGPGHFSLMQHGCAKYVSIHFYDNNANGFPTLDFLRLTMVDGWPVLSRDFKFGEDCDPVSVEKQSSPYMSTSLNIQPNPSTRGNFTIELPTILLNKQVKVEIFNINGSLIMSEVYNSETNISIEHHLKNGFYIINTSAEDFSFQNKLVVQ